MTNGEKDDVTLPGPQDWKDYLVDTVAIVLDMHLENLPNFQAVSAAAGSSSLSLLSCGQGAHGLLSSSIPSRGSSSFKWTQKSPDNIMNKNYVLYM